MVHTRSGSLTNDLVILAPSPFPFSFPFPFPFSFVQSGAAQLSTATSAKDMALHIARLYFGITAPVPLVGRSTMRTRLSPPYRPRKPQSGAIVKYRQMRQARGHGCVVWVWLLPERPFPWLAAWARSRSSGSRVAALLVAFAALGALAAANT
jgi:hypothetical protein